MCEFMIMTDGACDLPDAYLEAHHVGVVPLFYSFASAKHQRFPGRRAFHAKAFYTALRKGSQVRTAAANMEDFRQIMEGYAAAGKDILYVGFSAKLSSTFNVGRLTALEIQEKYPGRKVLCLNGRGGSLGQGMLVDLLVQMRENGATLEETFAQGEQLVQRMQHRFLVPDLMHLKRGGRIGSGTAVLGSMLHIMPILQANSEGALEVTGKVRGRRAALMKLAETVGESMEPGSTAAVTHADAPEDAMYVRDILRRKYGVKKVWLENIGPVLGAHCGPGAIAAFYLAK